MPIVYENIHQSIYCSRLTHSPSCLGFFHNIFIKLILKVQDTEEKENYKKA